MSLWTLGAGIANDDASAAAEPSLATSSELRFAAERERMVRTQISAPGRDIRDSRVIEAMRQVPRHQFVPKSQQNFAYHDSPLPIGYDQTISQPYIVAFMTEVLAPKPVDRILEIGTGSGYQAAILAKLAAKVYSIEIIQPLAESAAKTLHRLQFTNVFTKAGDGFAGWKEHAPFDAIIVTCAPTAIPKPLIEQLAEGGRMIIPVGPNHAQQLHLLEKRGGIVQERQVLAVRFVPMTGQAELR